MYEVEWTPDAARLGLVVLGLCRALSESTILMTCEIKLAVYEWQSQNYKLYDKIRRERVRVSRVR